MKTLLLLTVVLAFTGCARFLMPSAAQINALAKDTNTVHVSIQTIYGSALYERNLHKNP
jgi:hypothetical protein